MSYDHLIAIMAELGIDYALYSHEAIFGVRDGELYARHIEGAHCKNLFVQDAGKRLFLFITPVHKKVQLKDLAGNIPSRRLSFASDDVLEHTLGVKAGCVTPLALINDPARTVTVIIDKDVMNEERLCFHPLINTETMSMSRSDFVRFLDYCGHPRVFV